MKKLAIVGLLMIFAGVFLMKQDDIDTLIKSYFEPSVKEIELGDKNAYYRDYDFLFVQNTTNFSPSNEQDIMNIYYTIINAGKDKFTFYCPQEYKNCIKDIKKIAEDQTKLSDINNYVHPYNGFANIKTEYDSLGKVTVYISKTYTDDEIAVIDKKVDEIYKELATSLDTYTNIRNIHDFIIKNTRYDSDRSDSNLVQYKSDTAYGPLFQGYALCGGYTDLMELFLERLKVKSYKISSEEHIWNAVEFNGVWYHLDLTWDDPVVSDGTEFLEHTYFMIDTNTLQTVEKTQHNFNNTRYKEFN